MPTLMFNVKDVAQADGVNDDSIAINDYIAASPVGSKIFFPDGIYGMGAEPLILLPNRSYQGAAYGATKIKQLNGANLNAVVASQGYVKNNVFVDLNMEISDLLIDGNWANNSSGHGLALMNSFSIIKQLYFSGIPGSAIVVSDRSQSDISTTITQTISTTGSQTVSVGSTTGMSVGMNLAVEPTGANSEAVGVTAIPDSTHITANFTKTHSSGVSLSSVLMNSSIENKIIDCKVSNVNSAGLWVRDGSNNPGRCTDNHILNNTFSSCGAVGNVPTMRIERSAGCFIHRNHLYACQATGISCGAAWSTFITENEIDGYGANASPTGQYWKGISVTCIGPRATIISDNIISTSEPNASTVYQHLVVTAGGITTGRAIIQGNHVYGGGGDANHSIGMLLTSNGTQVGSGKSFFFVASGNRQENVGKALYVDTNTTTVLSVTEAVGDLQVDRHLLASAPQGVPTLAALSANGGSPPAPTFSSAGGTDVRGKPSFGSGTSPSAGAQVSVTYYKPFSSVPIVTVCASNAATAALKPYVDSPTANGFNIAFENAPAASQSGSTYSVAYIVIG